MASIALGTSAKAEEEQSDDVSVGERESLLKVDDFSPKPGRWSINAGVSYQGADHGGYIANTFLVPIDGGNSIAISTIQPTFDRSDQGNVTLGARYASSKQVNLFVQAGATASHARYTPEPGATQTRDNIDLGSLAAGIDFRLNTKQSRTNTYGFFSLSIVDRFDDDFIFINSITGGLTISHVVDPLILSISSSYTNFFPLRTDSGDFTPGNVLTLTPRIGFAVNPDINLSWGVSLSYRADEARMDADTSGVFPTVNIGLGYRLSKNRILNITSQAGVGGNDSFRFGVSFSQRF